MYSVTLAHILLVEQNSVPTQHLVQHIAFGVCTPPQCIPASGCSPHACPWKPVTHGATSLSMPGRRFAMIAPRQKAKQHRAQNGPSKRAFTSLLSLSSHSPSSDCKEKCPNFLVATTMFSLLISQTELQHVVFYITFESLRFSPGMKQLQYQLHQVELLGILQPLRPCLNLYSWFS